ncbi:MAG: sporulation protein YqfD [Christensenellales bacterium]|jgi:similar to stage IV sporulation protein
MTSIWHYLTGYVIIKVEGLALERLISLMRVHGLFAWDVRRLSYTILAAKISAFSLPKLRKLAADQPCRLSIVRRGGLSATFSFLRARRKGFLMGALAAVVLFFALTSFLWGIELEGLEDEALEQSIVSQLEDMGIRPGMLKAQMDFSQVEKRLLLDNPEIAWADVRLRGVILNIGFREADLPPDMQSKGYEHIIATKDAVIHSVTPLSGQAEVEVGQAVKAGETLISGIVAFEDAAPIYSTARGEVMGRVFYSARCSQDLFEQERTLTGRVATERFLIVGNWRVSLGKEGEPFVEYDEEAVRHEVSGLYLPCFVETVEYKEVLIQQKKLDLDRVLQEAQQKAYREIEGRLPEDAVIRKVSTDYAVSDGGELVANVLLESLEQIGEGRPYTPPADIGVRENGEMGETAQEE